MTLRRRLLLGLAVLGATGIGYAALRTGGADQVSPPAPMAVAPAPIGIGALGRVEPASRIRRLAHPGGMSVTRLERLLVAEGEEVAEGALLAEFADGAQKAAAVAQARAAVTEAAASLDRTRAAGRPSEVAAQREAIASFRAQEELALRDAARSERLVPTGAGAAAVADRSRSAAIRLAADRRQAEAQLDTLATSRPEDVALAAARLEAAEAALARAESDAGLSRVTAPFAGTILRIIARPGDQVGTDGLLEMGDLRRMEVVADVYETDLPRLRAGAAAEVMVPGEPRRFRATVREMGWTVRRQVQGTTDPVAAVDSRTVEVRLALDDKGSEALRRRSNMQVQVTIWP